MEGETDPNKLYDIETKIRGFNLVYGTDIDEFCEEFYTKSDSDETLQPPLNRVVQRWMDEDEEQREGFRSTIQSYVRLYGYISQIISFEDVGLEKLYLFLKYLNKKLPKRESGDKLDILDSVDLDSLRIQKIGEHQLSLEDTIGVLYPISTDVGGMVNEDEMDLLSDIINKVNEMFGIELGREDVVNVQQRLSENEELHKVMTGDNSETNKRKKHDEVLDKIIVSYVNERFEFYKKVENPNVKRELSDFTYRNYVSSFSR